jgi:hypothetical protein
MVNLFYLLSVTLDICSTDHKQYLYCKIYRQTALSLTESKTKRGTQTMNTLDERRRHQKLLSKKKR